ncbi:MAG: DUF3783 domain-containing protein [Peptostreptococcaceae bacterium]|nr:DUF3783 domain-containing protein [Peptostreptococcaceae bacterium]
MEKILLYGLDAERGSAVKKLLQEAGFDDVTLLSPEDAHHKAGYLHGLAGYEKESFPLKEEVPSAEFMMISGFDKPAIHRLFEVFKAAGSRRPVTSALTEINRDWPLGDIICEVCEEHEQLTGKKA